MTVPRAPGLGPGSFARTVEGRFGLIRSFVRERREREERRWRVAWSCVARLNGWGLFRAELSVAFRRSRGISGLEARSLRYVAIAKGRAAAWAGYCFVR